MTPEPFEEFRYSGCGTSSHSLQPIVLCLWLLLSFDLELQLCLASGAVSGCHFSWNSGWLHSRTSLVEFFGPCTNWRTAPFCPVPGLS